MTFRGPSGSPDAEFFYIALKTTSHNTYKTRITGDRGRIPHLFVEVVNGDVHLLVLISMVVIASRIDDAAPQEEDERVYNPTNPAAECQLVPQLYLVVLIQTPDRFDSKCRHASLDSVQSGSRGRPVHAQFLVRIDTGQQVRLQSHSDAVVLNAALNGRIGEVFLCKVGARNVDLVALPAAEADMMPQ